MLFANFCYKISSTCQNGSHPYSLDWALDYVGCATNLGYIANCAIYSAPKVCFACKEGFTDSGNSCIPGTPNAAITDCEFYSGNDCALCEEGKLYNSTGNTCDDPVISNCGLPEFSLLRCAKCMYGFSVDEADGTCIDTVDVNCN